ncbi:MAG: hypothetical protein ACKOC5_18320 [Chloroflexota bacterium]
MNMRYFALRLLLMLSLILGVVGCGGPPAAAPAEPVEPSATLPAPSETPAPQPAPSTPAPALPSETPPPSPTPPPPSPTPIPAVPGPETLDLGQLALFLASLTDYRERYSGELFGTGLNGQPLAASNSYTAVYRGGGQPAWSAELSIAMLDYRSAGAFINGRAYFSEADNACVPGSGAPFSPLSLLAGQLVGQAQRVEQEVQLDGLPADRYELKPEHLAPGAQIVLAETLGGANELARVVIPLSGSGSLYLARQGGYILRIELRSEAPAGELDSLFQQGTPLTAQHTFEVLPARPGDPPPALPPACQKKLDAAAQGTILLDDAEQVFQAGSSLRYVSRYTLEQAVAFYENELTAAGWSETQRSLFGPSADLTFTREGQALQVTMLQTGSSLAITVTRL